jgi:hypothetical protein
MPELLLNWELYNWAHSIIENFGISMKKKYYTEVKRLSRYSLGDSDIILVPGLNIFKHGEFKTTVGNNLGTNLFAYKEHIYLNSDRYIDEGGYVYNEIQFLPNIKLFPLTGKSLTGYFHEEMSIQVPNKDWTMTKINLCKDLQCIPKGMSVPQYTLKYEINYHLLAFCQ